jgi:hypothetical protein
MNDDPPKDQSPKDQPSNGQPAKVSTRQLLAGIPSVIAIVAMVWVTLALRGSGGPPPGWYLPTADRAFASGDFHTAAVCYERLLQSHPADKAITRNLARSLQAIGQRDAAASLMSRLAHVARDGTSGE